MVFRIERRVVMALTCAGIRDWKAEAPAHRAGFRPAPSPCASHGCSSGPMPVSAIAAASKSGGSCLSDLLRPFDARRARHRAPTRHRTYRPAFRRRRRERQFAHSRVAAMRREPACRLSSPLRQTEQAIAAVTYSTGVRIFCRAAASRRRDRRRPRAPVRADRRPFP